VNNHPTTRLASRRRYGELLAAGIEIWEYQPSMMHNKCLVVDGVWSVVGSTNFDNRSFGLNDEVNLAVLGQELAARLDDDFERDIAQSRAITYDDWSSRPFTERLLATLLIPLDRQE
jgi:cardiolipin synthase